MASSTKSQDGVWITFACIATLAFIVVQGFSFLDFGEENDRFESSTGNISDRFDTEITPAGWTFSIWGVIYIFQALWIIYILISICRRTESGPLYKNPMIVSVLFLAVYALNMALNVSWLLLWDRLMFEVALAVLILITFTLYVCLIDYHIRINKNVKQLAKGNKLDLFLFRLFLQNGVSIYATWCTIATLINLTIVLVYTVGLEQQVACLISLSVLALELVVFVALDMFVFERYLRYTFSTYLTVLWALSGSLAANWDPTKPHSIMSVILLGLTAILLVTKLVLTIINSQTKPLYVKDIIPTRQPENSA
ncbi:uncharacterized protein [Apostichopus japonicus]|uniref:uncharacterized protein n=1 Tax=Stichopus japonicus TaxID=307972 RepID=UPI003AB29D38